MGPKKSPNAPIHHTGKKQHGACASRMGIQAMWIQEFRPRDLIQATLEEIFTLW